MAILWAILTCGIYTVYWSYMTGKKMGEIDGSGSGAGLCLILWFFFGLFSLCRPKTVVRPPTGFRRGSLLVIFSCLCGCASF